MDKEIKKQTAEDCDTEVQPEYDFRHWCNTHGREWSECKEEFGHIDRYACDHINCDETFDAKWKCYKHFRMKGHNEFTDRESQLRFEYDDMR